MSLLDGKYNIEDCRRPFLILTTLLAPNEDKGPGGDTALELCRADEREGESDGEERTEPEASWRGRGPGDNVFNDCRLNLVDAGEAENSDGVFSTIVDK